MAEQKHTPFCIVNAPKVRELENNAENLQRMWKVFSRCADCLENGRRFENLSWRVWNRETLCTNPTSSISSSSLHLNAVRSSASETHTNVSPRTRQSDTNRKHGKDNRGPARQASSPSSSHQPRAENCFKEDDAIKPTSTSRSRDQDSVSYTSPHATSPDTIHSSFCPAPIATNQSDSRHQSPNIQKGSEEISLPNQCVADPVDHSTKLTPPVSKEVHDRDAACLTSTTENSDTRNAKPISPMRLEKLITSIQEKQDPAEPLSTSIVNAIPLSKNPVSTPPSENLPMETMDASKNRLHQSQTELVSMDQSRPLNSAIHSYQPQLFSSHARRSSPTEDLQNLHLGDPSNDDKALQQDTNASGPVTQSTSTSHAIVRGFAPNQPSSSYRSNNAMSSDSFSHDGVDDAVGEEEDESLTPLASTPARRSMQAARDSNTLAPTDSIKLPGVRSKNDGVANTTASQKGIFMLGGSSGEDESSFEDRHLVQSLTGGVDASTAALPSTTSALSRAESTSKKRKPPSGLSMAVNGNKSTEVSFRDEVQSRLDKNQSHEDERVFESSDEDYSGSSIIDEDDDRGADNDESFEEDEDWEDEGSDAEEVPGRPLFQRVDSRANLTSRRSLLTSMMHEGDRQNAFLKNAQAQAQTQTRDFGMRDSQDESTESTDTQITRAPTFAEPSHLSNLSMLRKSRTTSRLGGIDSTTSANDPRHRQNGGRLSTTKLNDTVADTNVANHVGKQQSRQRRATPTPAALEAQNQVRQAGHLTQAIHGAPSIPIVLSPRSTRRHMLATEMTESLRKAVLFERQQKKATAAAALKRRHTTQDLVKLTDQKSNLATKQDNESGSKTSSQENPVRRQSELSPIDAHDEYSATGGVSDYHQSGW